MKRIKVRQQIGYNTAALATASVRHALARTLYSGGYSDGSGGSVSLYYIYGCTGIVGFRYNGKSYYYVKNMQGDIVQIREISNNALTASYVYSAWGEHKVYDSDGNENTDKDFIGNVNPYRYRSYYYDTDMEMYFLQTRWYDPVVCRFINLDGIEYLDPAAVNGLNLYAYCNNNPVMNVDPEGTAWWHWVLLGVGAVVATALLVASVAASVVVTGGGVALTLICGVAGGVGFGYLYGVSSNIDSQLKTTGKIDPEEALLAGLRDAGKGAFTGLLSAGFGKVGELIGETIGMAIGSSVFLGKTVAAAFSLVPNLVTKVAIGVGSVVGTFLGELVGGVTLNPDKTIDQNTGDSIFNVIWDIFFSILGAIL